MPNFGSLSDIGDNWLGSQPTDIRDNYINEVDPSRLLSDPRFIEDIKRYYAAVKDEYLETDEDAIRRWYSDRTWSNLNTVGASTDWLEASNQDDEELKVLQARLQTAYERSPFFWQDGGMGDVDGWQAFRSISGALIADPINLVGGFLGKGAAAAKMASMAKTGQATTKGAAWAGAKSAAAGEAALNAGFELGHDALMQGRDIELGLSDGYDPVRGATATAAGGVLGGAMGGVVGGTTGALTARGAVRDMQAADAANIGAIRGLGLGDRAPGQSTIRQLPDGMSPEEYARQFHENPDQFATMPTYGRATDWQTPELTGDINIDGPRIEQARTAAREQLAAREGAESVNSEAAIKAREEKAAQLPEGFGAADVDLKLARQNRLDAEEEYRRAETDKVDEDTLKELRAEMDAAVLIDNLAETITVSKADIEAKILDPDPAVKRKGLEENAFLQKTIALYQRLLRGDEPLDVIEVEVQQAIRMLEDRRTDVPLLEDMNTRRPPEQGDVIDVDAEGNATVNRAQPQEPQAPGQLENQNAGVRQLEDQNTRGVPNPGDTVEVDAAGQANVRKVTPLEKINLREVLDIDGEITEGFVNAKGMYDNMRKEFEELYKLRDCLGL